jgi:hypothetical protein
MIIKTYYKIFSALLSLYIASPALAQEPSMEPFKLSQVRLLESPFLQAENVTLQYMLKLEPNRLLAP